MIWALLGFESHSIEGMDSRTIIESIRGSDLGLQFTENAQIAPLGEERQKIFASLVPGKIIGVVGEVDGEIREVVIGYEDATNTVHVPCISCQITFEDLSLSQCPEYRFADDEEWRVAQLSLLALDDFRKKKFKLWEHQLDEPECEAAFRRLLQQGPIRNVFDKFIFPSSDGVAAKYKVVDEHSGKSVDVPHQVSEMRIWNPSRAQYEPLDCSLVGAPANDEDARMYWERKLESLKELRGKEYIESLLGYKH
jgi:hypothetical protein